MAIRAKLGLPASGMSYAFTAAGNERAARDRDQVTELQLVPVPSGTLVLILNNHHWFGKHFPSPETVDEKSAREFWAANRWGFRRYDKEKQCFI